MRIESIEQTFSVRLPARLSLANIRGSVEIVAGEVESIVIQADKDLDSGDAENTQVILRQAADGSVSAETRFEGKNWFSLPAIKPCKVAYRVRVPRACHLQVRGVSNPASLQGVSGEVAVSTVSGALSLSDITGSLQVKSVSGDVSGQRIAGQLLLETVSGDVMLADSNLEQLNASTVSGDLSIHSPLSSSPVQLKSVSGDVILHVPAHSGFTINSQSISGDVTTRLPVTQRQKSFGQTRLQIGQGDTSILHRSISGDLIIQGNGGAEKPAAEMEQEITDSMELLERIERGEITVDEALHSLQPETPTA